MPELYTELTTARPDKLTVPISKKIEPTVPGTTEADNLIRERWRSSGERLKDVYPKLYSSPGFDALSPARKLWLIADIMSKDATINTKAELQTELSWRLQPYEKHLKGKSFTDNILNVMMYSTPEQAKRTVGGGTAYNVELGVKKALLNLPLTVAEFTANVFGRDVQKMDYLSGIADSMSPKNKAEYVGFAIGSGVGALAEIKVISGLLRMAQAPRFTKLMGKGGDAILKNSKASSIIHKAFPLIFNERSVFDATLFTALASYHTYAKEKRFITGKELLGSVALGYAFPKGIKFEGLGTSNLALVGRVAGTFGIGAGLGAGEALFSLGHLPKDAHEKMSIIEAGMTMGVFACSPIFHRMKMVGSNLVTNMKKNADVYTIDKISKETGKKYKDVSEEFFSESKDDYFAVRDGDFVHAKRIDPKLANQPGYITVNDVIVKAPAYYKYLNKYTNKLKFELLQHYKKLYKKGVITIQDYINLITPLMTREQINDILRADNINVKNVEKSRQKEITVAKNKFKKVVVEASKEKFKLAEAKKRVAEAEKDLIDTLELISVDYSNNYEAKLKDAQDRHIKRFWSGTGDKYVNRVFGPKYVAAIKAAGLQTKISAEDLIVRPDEIRQDPYTGEFRVEKQLKGKEVSEVELKKEIVEKEVKEEELDVSDVSFNNQRVDELNKYITNLGDNAVDFVADANILETIKKYSDKSVIIGVNKLLNDYKKLRNVENFEVLYKDLNEAVNKLFTEYENIKKFVTEKASDVVFREKEMEKKLFELEQERLEREGEVPLEEREVVTLKKKPVEGTEIENVFDKIDKIDIEKKPKEKKKLTQEEAITKLKTMLGEDLKELDDYFPFDKIEVTKTDKQENFKDRDQIKEFNYDDKIYKEAFFPKIKKAWQAAKGDDISLLHFCATVLDVYTRKWRQYVAKFYNENFNEEYGNVKIKDTTPIWGKDEQGNKIRILARADTKNKIIHVDKELVTAHFKGKNEYIEGITDTIWTRGKHGVENLYPDTFKTVKDFMNFVIEHEKTHFEQTVKDIKNKALRENVANYIALEMLGLKVPHQLESIALGHLIDVKYGKGYDLNKIVRTINNYNKIIKLTPDQIAYKYNVDVDKIKDIFKKAGNFEKFSELIGNEVEKLSDSEKRSMYWTFSNARYGGLFGIGKDGKLYEYSEKDFRLEIPIDRIFSAKEFRIYNGDNREKNKGIMSQDVVDKLFKNGEIPYSPRGEGERWYVFKISKNILEMSDDGIRDKFNNEPVFESAKKYVGNNVKQMRIELARKEIHDKIFGSQANNIAEDVFETLKRVKIAVTPNKRILSELLGRKNFTLGIINHKNSPFSKDIADGGSYILPETVNEIFKTHGIDSKIGGFKPIGYFIEGNDVLFTKTFFNSPPPEMAKFMRDNGIEILEFESAAKVRGGRFKNLIDVEVSDNDVITSRDMKDKIQNVPVESFGVLYAEQLDLVGNPSVSTQIGNLILRHPDAISPAKIIDKLIETFVQPEIDNYRKFIIDKDNIKKLTEWLLKTIDPSDRYSASEFGSLDNIPQKDFIKFLENNGNPLTDRRYSEILKQIINKQLIRNITHPRGVGGTFPASPDLFKRLEYSEVFVAKSMQEIGTSIGDRVLIVKIPAGQVEGILVGTVKGFLHESQGNTAQVSSKWFVEKIGNDYDADAIQIIVNAPKELLDYFGNHPYKGIEYGTVDNKAVYGDVCKSFYHLPSVIKIHNVLLQSKKDIGFTASFSRLYSFLYNSKFKIQIGNNVYDMNNHTEQQLRDNLKYFNSILQSNVDALKVGPIRFNKDEAMRRVFEKTDGGKIPQEDFDIIKVVVNNLSSKLGIFSKNYSINSEGETFTLVELFKRIEGYKYFVNAMRGIIPENQFNPLFHNGNTQKEHRSFRTGEKPSKALAAARHYSSMFAEGKIKVSFEQGNTFYEGIVKAMSEGGIDKHFGAIDNTQKLWREDGSAYIPNKSKRFIGYDKQIMQVDGIKKQEAIESACERLTVRQLEDVLYKNISFEKQNEIKNSINAYRELWGMFEWSGQEAGEKRGISEVGERDLIKNISTVLKMSVKEVESLLALDSKSFADIWKKQVLEFYGDLKKENKSFSILAQLLMRKPELKETVDRRYQHYNYKYEPKPASFLMDNNVEKLFNDLYNDVFSYVIAHKLSPQRELLNPNNPLYKGTASDFIIPSIERVKEQIIEKVKEQTIETEEKSKANQILLTPDLFGEKPEVETSKEPVIERPKRILRQDAVDNPDKIYIFGDNDARSGLGGLAKELRGLKNSIGIRTKKRPATTEGSFYTDKEFESNKKKINQDLAKVKNAIKNGKTIVIAEGGIGTGLAKLKEKAPETFRYLQNELKEIFRGDVKTKTEKPEIKITGKESIKTKGGFSSEGKGTAEGDGKDKAMREIADDFIGEIVNEESSSATSREYIWEKDRQRQFREDYRESGETYLSRLESGEEAGGEDYGGTRKAKVVMLARNKEFTGKDLKQETKNKILEAYKTGVKFVVGDMPNVDSQFIDYLQEIGAKFTVYHTGEKPRITVEAKTVPTEKTEEEFSFKAEPETITLTAMPKIYGTSTEKQSRVINELLVKNSKIREALPILLDKFIGHDSDLSKITQEQAVNLIKTLRRIDRSGTHPLTNLENVHISTRIMLPDILKNFGRIFIETKDGEYISGLEAMQENGYTMFDMRNRLDVQMKKLLHQGAYIRDPKSIEDVKRLREEVIAANKITEALYETLKRNAIDKGEKDAQGYVKPEYQSADVLKLIHHAKSIETMLKLMEKITTEIKGEIQYEDKVYRIVGAKELLKKSKNWGIFIDSLKKVGRALDGKLSPHELTEIELGFYLNARQIFDFCKEIINDYNEWIKNEYNPYFEGVRKPLKPVNIIEKNYFARIWESIEAVELAFKDSISKEREKLRELGFNESEITDRIKVIESQFEILKFTQDPHVQDLKPEYKGKFFGNFLPRSREGFEIDGYNENALEVTEMYIEKLLNKVFSDKLELANLKVLDAIKVGEIEVGGKILRETPEMIRVLEDFHHTTLGRPRQWDINNPKAAKAINTFARNAIATAFYWFMGGRASFAIINMTQSKNIWIQTGTAKTLAGLTGMFDPEVQRACQESGVGKWHTKTELARLSAGKGKEIAWHFQQAFIQKSPQEFFQALNGLRKSGLAVAGFPATASEIILRKWAFCTEYMRTRESGVRDHKDWIKLGNKMVRTTQFVYENFNRPEVGRTPLGKLLTLYTTYIYNQYKFNFDLFHNAIEQYTTPGGFTWKNADTRQLTYKLARWSAVNGLLIGLSSLFAYSFFDRLGDETMNFAESFYDVVNAESDEEIMKALTQVKYSLPVGLPIGTMLDLILTATDGDLHRMSRILEPVAVRDVRRTLQTKDLVRITGLWKTYKNK